jgi:hypothetical protein
VKKFAGTLSVLFALILLPGFCRGQQAPASQAPVGQSSSAPATASPTPLPTANQIFDRYRDAIGGEAAWLKVQTRTSKGTIEIEGAGMTGAIEAFEQAPDKSSVTVTLPGYGSFIQVYDGVTAWSADPQNGLRELSGSELAAAKREANFYLPVHFSQYYPDATVKGKDKINGHDVYIVQVSIAGGNPEALAFDTETGLLIHRAGSQDSPQGKVSYEVYLEDYQIVDGIKIPSTIRQTSPSNFTLHMMEVHDNVPIDPAKFNKPTAGATAPPPAAPPVPQPQPKPPAQPR